MDDRRIEFRFYTGASCIKENAKALIVASKGIGLEVNADKPKYMAMSRDQNTGRSHNTDQHFL